MAIWQYRFRLVPNSDLKELSVTAHLLDDDYDNFAFWRNGNYKIDFFEGLTSVLKSKASWSKEIKLYGTEDSNCIEIFIDSNTISEVTVRIDYLSNYQELLSRLIEFCLLNSLALIGEDNKVLHLNATSIIYVIQNSPQYHKLTELKDK